MAKDRSDNIRLGIFVTAGLFLFMAAVYVVGARQSKFGEQYHLEARFNNANGLQVGHNVRYNGIKVGSVEDIIFLNDSTLRVKMLLDKDLKRLIRRNAVASIGTEGLVGDVVINIKPGLGNEPLAEDGATLPSIVRPDGAQMMETLGSTNENIALIAVELLELTTKLNEGNGTLPLLIRDSIMAVELVMTLENLRKASENLNALAQDLQVEMKGIAAGQGTLGYLLHDQSIPKKAESLLDGLDSMVMSEMAPILQNLHYASQDISKSSAALKMVMEDINHGGGMANVVLRDTAAAFDMQQTLENLNKGTARFNENMEAMKHNFLFRRYFKKMEKEKRKKN